MSSWRAQYLKGLEARDRREQANQSLIKSYTALADRTAVAAQDSPAPADSPLIEEAPSPARLATGASDKGKGISPAAVETQLLARFRHDLGEAQRSKAELQAQLKTNTAELERLSTTSQRNAKRVQELATERTALVTKVRDRDEELRGKAKLLENVQDEMISLNLQLNVAEKRAQDLQTENRELVDRWMARMGKEADAMNDASKF
ncbi:MAG: hypothetical protein M1826_000789 [Phylliscum demangeonii]|nr:MAG: hypothetical protein M1826_000789 [Phylliscum demangeonii]